MYTCLENYNLTGCLVYFWRQYQNIFLVYISNRQIWTYHIPRLKWGDMWNSCSSYSMRTTLVIYWDFVTFYFYCFGLDLEWNTADTNIQKYIYMYGLVRECLLLSYLASSYSPSFFFFFEMCKVINCDRLYKNV